MTAATGPFPLPGGWHEQEFALADRRIRLLLPAVPDALLDDPEVLAANARDDYMPYWCYLWPASLETAQAVLRQQWPPEAPALEIGAGIALVSMAALAAGLRVTISDYEPRSLRLALYNAGRNGWAGRARAERLDWRAPPQERYQVIFACDVIYEERNHEPILDLLETMLADDGQAWVSDPGRHLADRFTARLAGRPFSVQTRMLPQVVRPGRPPGGTTLWILRKKSG